MSKLLKPLLAITLASCFGFIAPATIGDSVTIPLGQQGDHWNIKRPNTGMSKEQVQSQYGTPESQSGPVGTPAIYTWNYPKFKVFFENDRVIHSVVTSQ